ncbi:Transmembrane protein FAM155A [Merluccius polli]|uniref:Transmembrane protein FAM155A n=1 Tax=Merluccius polli TaxID=89951 RepID=A0AA47PBX6_MERPO|nr:Transmembrane protein FAM155A [Merluccius polli]
MTRGAWMRRQQDEGLKFWFAPRENEKPFAESERAQRWRLSLASLLFITVLLSDHLWFCAEAKLTRTRDKRSDGEYPNSQHNQHHHNHQQHHQHHPPPHQHHPHTPPPAPHSLANREPTAIFIGNSTKPLRWRTMATCHRDSLSKDCLTRTDAGTACLLALSGARDAAAERETGTTTGTGGTTTGTMGTGAASWQRSDLYLSFCNSYSLLDLLYGFTSGPAAENCTLDAATGAGCDGCVDAYRRLDRQAEDRYREFELLVEKYETDAYSVRTCMDECKDVTY